MKIAFRLLILLLVISCNKKSEEELPKYETQEELNKRITEGKPFFDFDEVVHYQIDISDKDYYDLIRKDKTSNKTKLLSVFLQDEVPISDQAKLEFQSAIKSERVIENVIDSKYYDELRTKIFAERKCGVMTVTACVPLYRDIFVFSKNKKETGIVKICFGCDQVSFSEGNFIYDCFGNGDEFVRIINIIEENKKLK